jgi:hypothetical protein
MQSSRFFISFSNENSLFCQNHVENCTQIFLQFDVNGDKSDVFQYDRLERRLTGFPASRVLIILVQPLMNLPTSSQPNGEPFKDGGLLLSPTSECKKYW